MKLALVALVLSWGCRSQPASDGRNPPLLERSYSDGASGLQELWSDILRAAQRDERERVHLLMASLIMTDEDLDALFGVEQAKTLRPRYLPMIGTLVNIGAMELVAQIVDKKYDDIEVFRVDDQGSTADRATLAALPRGTAVYGLRVKKKSERLGLRYDFFVYRKGRWVTGNLLAKYLLSRDGGSG